MDAIGFKEILFIALAIAAVVSSLLMVTRKDPIHSALWMIATFFVMAVIYLLLNAQFIAVAQVMVYAGAIMMLILFVIMLVHMERGPQCDAGGVWRSKTTRVATALITAILFGEVLFGALFSQLTGKSGDYPAEAVNSIGNVKAVGSLLYGQYLFPFEIASILLLVGIVGAVVIAKRK
ncbi:MAG: NADH-quinone oxidoreductase subunit J family protein [Syntrophales bacterium]